MLRIITLNLNGIRSAWSKGVYPWLLEQGADIVCFQELKAHHDDLGDEMIKPEGFHAYYHFAEKRGYSGVGLWCRKKPNNIVGGFNKLATTDFYGALNPVHLQEFGAEGRYLRADFSNFSVISLYLPSGSSSPLRQAAKFRFMEAFYPHLMQLGQNGFPTVVCGDLNIAHQEIDLYNWKSNQKNSGFLPEERHWIGQILGSAGWHDVYRKLYPEAREECYTWWSNRGQARAKNVGWRLDYQLATSTLAEVARNAKVYKGHRFSDHAPVIVDYDFS